MRFLPLEEIGGEFPWRFASLQESNDIFVNFGNPGSIHYNGLAIIVDYWSNYNHLWFSGYTLEI